MEEAETKKQEKAMEKEHGRHGLKKIKTGTQTHIEDRYTERYIERYIGRH